ncbi:MAG TPA: ABC transporter [Clostridiales bacterium]|nr:ABC transporter [Clostridiales bacterium]
MNTTAKTTATLLSDTWWVAWREIKRFQRQKVRIVMILVQPFIWLALMGNMFERMAQVPGFPADSYLDYMAPGVVTMVTLFGGIFGGMSIVWDRRLGYLNKLLAAPIARSAVVSGKMLAVGLQTGVQVAVIFVIAMLMGVSFKTGPLGALTVILLAVLLSLVFAGISLSFSAVITSHEALMAVVNFLTMPLMFTSNAMMPLSFMPSWLQMIAKLNPLSYAINPMRSLFLTGWNVQELLTGVVVLALAGLALGHVATCLFRRSLA